MKSRAILLRPRWLLGHVLALSLIALFVILGVWQLRRLEERTSINAVVKERADSEPRSLADLKSEFGSDPEELAFRPAVVTGQYEPSSEVLLRSRSRNGQAGFHVLTPLIQESGRALLVDRGWVPYSMDEPPVEEALPPQGTVTVEGLVRAEQDPPEGWLAGLAPRDPAEGPLLITYYADVERLAGQVPYPLEPVYLELSAQNPGNEGRLPLPPAAPEVERGPHLAYALQWFSFALIGLVGYTLLLRRTVHSGLHESRSTATVANTNHD